MDDSAFGLFVLLAFNLCSIGSCLWISLRLRKLDEDVKARLFVRQLRYLLVSDTLAHVSLIPILASEFGGHQEVPSRFCYWSYMVFAAFGLTSVWLETVIALSFLFQTFQCNLALKITSHALPLVTLLASGLGIGIVLDEQPYFDEQIGGCYARENKKIMYEIIVCPSVVATMSYIASLAHAWRASPHSVVRRNFMRAAVYPFNFILTYGLFLYVWPDMLPRLDQRPMLSYIAFLLISCSGLLNSLAYAWQSRVARATLRVFDQHSQDENCRATPMVRACEFERNVMFGGVDIVEVAPLECIARARLHTDVAMATRPGHGRSF